MTVDALDVRHLPYMPLVIETLRKSKTWLRCRRQPDLGFYLINLWMRAWHEVPAGSIEDDDDILADAAMCAPERWLEIRGVLLEGWETQNGRVCHRTVTDLATEAVTKIKVSKDRTAAARAKAAEQRKLKEEQAREEAERLKQAEKTPTISTEMSVTESVTDDEGRREGRSSKEKETPSGVSKKRAVRLSPDWQCPDDWIDEAVEAGLTRAKALSEADRMKNWSLSNPKGAKIDWLAAWRNWYKGKLDDDRKRGSGRDAEGILTNDFLFARG